MTPEYTAAVATRLSELRRQAASESLMVFARTYLRRHFTLPPSPMHLELVAKLEAITFRDRSARLAVAAPRGHAKSTLVSLAYVLWCAVYGRERLIYVISNTIDQAADHLANVKAELEGNELLWTDFPEVCEPPGGKPRPKRWRSREIITRNEIKIVAFGSGSKLRGRKHGAERPSLILLDDLEHEEEADSPDRREKLLSWLHQSVLNAGTTQTNFVVVGTILNYGSVLATLVDSPAWWSRKYQAVVSWATNEGLWERWSNVFNHLAEHEGESGSEAARALFEANRPAMIEGTGSLWPEKESYYDLMVMRIVMGTVAFDAEKLNNPVNPRDAVFRAQDFRYWDEEHDSEEALLAAVGKRGIIVGALDPSLGKAGRNRDDSAIVSLLVDRGTGIKYVLDAFIARLQPDEIIEAVVSHERRRHFRSFAVETVQFQDFLATELVKRSRRAGFSVPVKRVTPTRDKLGRIQSLQPMVHNGEIRFCRRHRQLLDQLKQFPKAARDDGPDALEMAVQRAAACLRRRGRIRTARFVRASPGSPLRVLVFDE